MMGAVSALTAQNEPERYTIKGQIADMADSSVVALKVSIPRGYLTLALDTVTDGKFEFGDTLSAPSASFYVSVETRGYAPRPLHVWVAPGQTSRIEGSGKILQEWKVESPQPEQESYRQMYEAQMPEIAEVIKAGIQESRLFDSLFIDLKGDDKAFGPIFKQVDSIRAATKPLESIATSKKIAYMQTAKVDDVWLDEYLYLVYSLERNKDPEYQKTVRALAERMKGNTKDKARAIADRLSVEKIARKGDKMVDGELWDKNGNRRTLSEFAGKGKYILLDFWTSTCGPCIQSIPEMEEVIKRHGDKLTVVGISLDDKTRWKEALKKYQMNGEQLNELLPEGMGLSARYGVTGIPHYFMINPEGVIIDQWGGYGEGHLIKNVERNF